MAKSKDKDVDDIFSDLLNEDEDGGETTGAKPGDENSDQKDKRKMRGPTTVKIGNEDVPIEKIPDVVASLNKKLEERDKEFTKFRDGLTKAVSGKEEVKDEDDSFDEVEFLANKDYRKNYINSKVSKLVDEKVSELKKGNESTAQEIGQMRYGQIREEVAEELDEAGVEFDIIKNEEKLSKVMLESFSPNFIRSNPKKAMKLAVAMISKSNSGASDDSSFPESDVERPSRGVAGGKTKTEGDVIRERILHAKQGDSDTGSSPFG